MKKLFLFQMVLIFGISQKSNAQIGTSVPLDGLKAYYSFNENMSRDDSGNGHDGVVHGNVALVEDRFGRVSNAIKLTKHNDSIVTNYAGILGTASRTINYWYKSQGDNYISPVGYGKAGGTNLGTGFTCGFGYQTPGVTIDCGTSAITYTANSKVNDGTWKMYSWVFDNTQGDDLTAVKVYQNGVLLESIAHRFNEGTKINTIEKIPFKIFGYPETDVYVDDIGIWNRALSAEEITNMFNSNICFREIEVTDKLIINIETLSVDYETFKNTIMIYPNPTSDTITIDSGNLTSIQGYSVKIINSSAIEMYSTEFTNQQHEVSLTGWSKGLYFVQIINNHGKIIDVKKIVLE